MTLSARASTFGGMVRPICLAAFRLMMNSNFFGCSTGRSAGLAPLRILSTYVAARRNKSVIVRAVIHKSAGFDIFRSGVDCRQPMLYRKVDNLLALEIEDGIPQHQERIGTSLGGGSEHGLNILGI